MKTYVSKKMNLLYIPTGLSFIATFIMWLSFPATIVTKWDATGVAISSRPSWFLLLLALLPIATILISSLIPREDKDGNPTTHPSYYQITIAILSLLLIGYLWVIIAFNKGVVINTNPFILMAIACGIWLGGNHLRNLPFGAKGLALRLAWIVDDEKVWQQTHKYAGYGFMAVGILTTIAAVLAMIPAVPIKMTTATIIGLAALLLTALCTLTFSWQYYKKIKKAELKELQDETSD